MAFNTRAYMREPQVTFKESPSFNPISPPFDPNLPSYQNPLFFNHNQPSIPSFDQNSPQFPQQPNFNSNPPFNPNHQNPPFDPNCQPWNAQPYVNEPPTLQENHQLPQVSSSKLENALMSFMQQAKAFRQDSQATIKNHEASLRNLEIQIGHCSKQLVERPQEALPSDSIEQCHSFSTRSERVVGMENEEPNVVEVEENHEVKAFIEKLKMLEPLVGKENEEPNVVEVEENHEVKEFIETLKMLEPLVGNIPKENDVASPYHLIVDGESKRVKELCTTLDAKPIVSCLYSNPLFEDGTQEMEESTTKLDARSIVPCLYSNPLFEDGPNHILQSHELNPKEDDVEFEESQEIKECIEKLKVLEPLVENTPKKNVDFGVEQLFASPNQLIFDGESKGVEELLANLEASCMNFKSFFEDSASYILQPQGLHPILKKILQKETTPVPFDPPHVSIPWDPGGKPFDKFLPCNFKPP